MLKKRVEWPKIQILICQIFHQNLQLKGCLKETDIYGNTRKLSKTEKGLKIHSEIDPLSQRNKAPHYVERELVLGSLLQILCSLVHVIVSKNGEVEGGNLLNQWPMVAKVNELIPAFSVQVLAPHSH